MRRRASLMGDSRTPAIVSVLSIGVNLALNLMLSG
jgi:Na+-driven multidrug efflux pump